MKYRDGSIAMLGDHVEIPVPDGTASARVVMLGDTREHAELDQAFLTWVGSTDVLRSTAVVIEWIGPNPFAHQDPNSAPVGNYMFTDLDEFVEFKSRTAV